MISKIQKVLLYEQHSAAVAALMVACDAVASTSAFSSPLKTSLCPRLPARLSACSSLGRARPTSTYQAPILFMRPHGTTVLLGEWVCI